MYNNWYLQNPACMHAFVCNHAKSTLHVTSRLHLRMRSCILILFKSLEILHEQSWGCNLVQQNLSSLPSWSRRRSNASRWIEDTHICWLVFGDVLFVRRLPMTSGRWVNSPVGIVAMTRLANCLNPKVADPMSTARGLPLSRGKTYHQLWVITNHCLTSLMESH